MRLIPWKTPFSQVEWLICESLRSDCEFALDLELVEHHVVEIETSDPLPEDPIERLIATSKPIIETPESRRWLLSFDHVVAFRSESESYSHKPHWPSPEVISSTYFLDESPWIKEIGEQYLNDLVPGSKHFVIFTSHVHIEVISPNEPSVKEV